MIKNGKFNGKDDRHLRDEQSDAKTLKVMELWFYWADISIFEMEKKLLDKAMIQKMFLEKIYLSKWSLRKLYNMYSM